MADDKRDLIEPITDGGFDDVVRAVAPRPMPAKGPKIVPERDRVSLADNDATHRGKLRIGPVEIPCAVLKDGRRVLSGTGIANALGGRSGAAKRLKTEAEKSGAHMPVFLASKSLLPYVFKELTDGPLKPITYQSGDGEVEGYAAEALPEICNIWLQAPYELAIFNRTSA